MQFEKQQYQQDCVDNIIRCLHGVDIADNPVRCLQENIRALAADKGYGAFPTVARRQLDVLMETGTGKTFTYIKTIFELNKEFGMTKFIIVLPRIAIKLGTIQNIRLSDEYFFNEYGKHLKIIDYRGKDDIAAVQQEFIKSGGLCVLITTNSAFNSEKNNINKRDEALFRFNSTWEGVAQQDSVVIIDEPHLLKGTETQKGLSKLEKSLFIRFGATYPDEEEHRLANVVYVLDSISAFNQYLVKRIAVTTTPTAAEVGNLCIRNVKPQKKCFDVAYNINEQPYERTVRLKDDLGAKTQHTDYHGAVVTKIAKKEITLIDGRKIPVHTGNYLLNDDEITAIIKATIQLHFKKEEALFARGIKALSLFFIPNIADFRGDKPCVKEIFEEQYRAIRDAVYQQCKNAEYKAYLDRDFSDDGKLQVHEGYFSGDKGTKERQEMEGVDLILKQKEKLLSFNTPLRFIFSVWALQEGWDNPNVFTISKLSGTEQEISRRQQVGRGLRLAINQSGRRLTYRQTDENEDNFYAVNTLDVVVSGREHDFIYGIQREIQDASDSIVGNEVSINLLQDKGLNFKEIMQLVTILSDNKIVVKFEEERDTYILAPMADKLIQNNKDKFCPPFSEEKFKFISALFANCGRGPVVRKKQKSKDVKVNIRQWAHFLPLWETINKKADFDYKEIDQDDLIDKISKAFNSHEFGLAGDQRRLRKIYNTQTDMVDTIEESAGDYTAESATYFQHHNFGKFVKRFAKDEKWPISFIVSLFRALDLEKFHRHPRQAQSYLSYLIEEMIHQTVVCTVSYQFNETCIYANELQDDYGNLNESICHTALGKSYSDETPPQEFLYDTIVFDSDIEKRSIVDNPQMVDGQRITVFAKLPKISIPTPYKTYNPDFAYLVKDDAGESLFLVVETKGYKFADQIPHKERMKIDYGKKFFEALQKQVPDVKIRFKTRMTGQELSDLLRGIREEEVQS